MIVWKGSWYPGVDRRLSWTVVALLLVMSTEGCAPPPEKSPTRETPAADGIESRTVPADSSDSTQSMEVRANLSHEDLDGTAWMQTSAEYVAITRQTYRSAQRQLVRALSDKSWTAWPPQIEQLKEETDLPPAVILDVDETVLENTGFQAQLIFNEVDYSPKAWEAWVHQQRSRAIPGAQKFLDSCRESGVAVFFVTNREHSVEDSTRMNLEASGLRDAAVEDNVLSKHEREEWVKAGSDKTPRREYIAKTHRILIVLGDDLNDFVDAGIKPTPEARRAAADKFDSYWGVKWFVLPNPSYGGWERALYEFNDRLPRETKLQKKRESLWLGLPHESD